MLAMLPGLLCSEAPTPTITASSGRSWLFHDRSALRCSTVNRGASE